MADKRRKKMDVLDNGMYIGDNKLLDFIPCIEEVREVATSKGIQVQYKIAIKKCKETVDSIVISDLYVKSWFKLSRCCTDAALTNNDRRLIEQYLEGQVAEQPVVREIHLDKRGWYYIGEGRVYYRNNIIICKALSGILSKEQNAAIIEVGNYKADVCKCALYLESIKMLAFGTSWIVYLVSYFDVLKEVFREAGYPIEFITNIYGKSGSGKTSLVKAVCSPSQVFSFRSIERRDILMRKIVKFGGHTILVDDYHPSENKADNDRQGGIKDSLVRLVEESAEAPNIIISSEYLDGHISLQDREIQIYLDENLDWRLLNSISQNKEALEKIRIAFYVQIVMNKERVLEDIKHFCMRGDDNRMLDGNDSFRGNRYMEYIHCVDYLFKKYFIEAYGIEWDYDVSGDLQEHLQRQNKHMEVVRVFEQRNTYLIAVRDMLLCDEVLNQVYDWKKFIPDASSLYIKPDGRVCISYKALLHGMIAYLRRREIPMKKIIDELVKADVLVTYDAGKEYTKKKEGKRYYEIDTDALNEYCALFE